MKVAILSKTVCQPTERIIKYFNENNFKIDSVIIEKKYRKKFSVTEISFRKAHDKFNQETKKYSLIRRITKQLWDLSPMFVNKFVFTNIYDIPLLRKFSVHYFCDKHNIKVFEVEKHSSNETKDIILNRDLDYILMVSSNWLLKEPILSIPNTKIINAHSGWLPKHKGLDSIAWSILENDPIGLTTHYINSGVDSGAILKFYEVKIEKGDDFNTITNKIGNLQPFAFLDTLKGLETGDIKPIPQDDTNKPHKPLSFEKLLEVNNLLTKET
jgi:folate-dependent phosphoribosylglycinamide formyltransferase PurN